MLYGYCIVSTNKKDKETGEYVQTTDLQIGALLSRGVLEKNIWCKRNCQRKNRTE